MYERVPGRYAKVLADGGLVPIGQDGTNMLAREAREIVKDLILAHPTGEVLEDIGRRNAGSGKRRLGAAHPWGDLNKLLPVHDEVLC
jgi:hypothetical protein